MKIDLSLFRSEPREMKDDTIDVVSTSSKTASASPIILKQTDMIQTKFEPILIENDKAPEKSVSGKLIYEKKRIKDADFPSEKITRQSITVGEMMEISLGTTETYNLYDGLKKLYSLYEEMGDIPFGSATFTRIDSSFKQFQEIIQNDPSAARMIGCPKNFELVKILLQLITQTDSLDSLKSSLKNLAPDNVLRLTNALNIERLERTLLLMEQNIDNSSEEFWQKDVFQDNQWIISQLFSSPCTIFEDKAYMGGKSIGNHGGNVCDFIYQNKLTQNVALIEIKTPCTEIIGSSYRDTFCLSAEMSGAINQVINYRDKLTKEYYVICNNSDSHFEMFNPKCLVLIGRISELTKKQIATFENYRNSLSNVIVITYDEMIQRIKDLVTVFTGDNSDGEDFEEEALPF
jgi:hypothetical protein